MTAYILAAREALQITILDAAHRIGISEIEYQQKENGPIDFTKDEVIQLWNYFTPLIERAPKDVQELLKELR